MHNEVINDDHGGFHGVLHGVLRGVLHGVLHGVLRDVLRDGLHGVPRDGEWRRGLRVPCRVPFGLAFLHYVHGVYVHVHVHDVHDDLNLQLECVLIEIFIEFIENIIYRIYRKIAVDKFDKFDK
jgi:hypothetical protein